MDNPTKINHIQADASRVTISARSYRVGQQLMATVINGSTTSGNVIIRIGNETLQVRSTMNLSEGDILKLEVMRLQPQNLLSVVAINGGKPSMIADPLKSALIQLQPRQGGMPELLSTVNILTSDHTSTGLPAQLSPYLRQLLSFFISRHEITDAGALGQAFLNSGLFLENKLLNGKTGKQIHQDLKFSLLSLLGLLGGKKRQNDISSKPPRRDSSNTALPPHRDAQPVPQPRVQVGNLGAYSEFQIQAFLHDLIKASLSRLTLHQIATAENSRKGKLRWLTEIPIYDGDHPDVLHLCIEREAHGTGEGAQDYWAAELALDLPTLGPLRARISLYKGQISSTLWAENACTVDKLNSSLSKLEDALEARKLKVRSLACYAGTPVSTAQEHNSHPLLDIQA